MVVLGVALVALGRAPVIDAVLIALWGMAFGGVPVAWSTWVTRTVPDEAESAGGLIVDGPGTSSLQAILAEPRRLSSRLSLAHGPAQSNRTLDRLSYPPALHLAAYESAPATAPMR